MDNDTSRDEERRASRVAIVGIVLAMAFTAAGMMLRSPVLGGLALVTVLVAVLFRRSFARLLHRASP